MTFFLVCDISRLKPVGHHYYYNLKTGTVIRDVLQLVGSGWLPILDFLQRKINERNGVVSSMQLPTKYFYSQVKP